MILDRIVAAKRREVASLKKTTPLARLQEVINDLPPTRDFRRAINHRPCAIIAEVKRSSPSKGRIREQFDPVQHREHLYEKHGAQAISVLTDEQFFEGKGEYLAAIKKTVALPLLRKDFIIDAYQIYETRVLGGDAAAPHRRDPGQRQLQEYIQLAGHTGADAFGRGPYQRRAGKGPDRRCGDHRHQQPRFADIYHGPEDDAQLAPLIPKATRSSSRKAASHTRKDIDAC